MTIDTIRPLVGRLVAALLLPLLVKGFARLGVPMPDHLVTIVEELCVALVAYSVGHRLLSRWTDPGDAASLTLGRAERAETTALRAARAAQTERR